MIQSLNKLIPQQRRTLAPEKLEEYTEHFKKVLIKYGYTRDVTNAAQFDRLASYMAEYCAGRKGEASRPAKGLFLYGKPGAGKTHAMRIFSGVFEIEFIQVWQLTKAFTADGARAFWDTIDNLHGKDCIIDDIANESAVRRFGNTFPIIDLLAARNAENNALTFFTSNADGKTVSGLYGDFIYSRICGMCEPLKFDGVDHRRLKPQTTEENK